MHCMRTSFVWGTNQSFHGAVESMSVVSSELRVGSFERRVSVGLRLLDAIQMLDSRPLDRRS